MNDRDTRREGRAGRVVTFGLNNSVTQGGDLPADHVTTPHFAAISDGLKDLALEKARQLTSSVSKASLRDALWLDFKDIIRTGRAIKQMEAGFDATPYALPEDKTDSLVNTYADKLLRIFEDNPKPTAEGGDTPAKLAAKAALRAKFVHYDLPADFVEDLRADRDAMDETQGEQNTSGQQGVESTAAITKILSTLDLHLNQIDTTLRNRYRTQPEKLAAWLTAARLERAPQRRKKVEGGNTPSK